MLFHYHDGVACFPHGSGPSLVGWYAYSSFTDAEPSGPYPSLQAAFVDAELAGDLPEGASLR